MSQPHRTSARFSQRQCHQRCKNVTSAPSGLDPARQPKPRVSIRRTSRSLDVSPAALTRVHLPRSGSSGCCCPAAPPAQRTAVSSSRSGILNPHVKQTSHPRKRVFSPQGIHKMHYFCLLSAILKSRSLFPPALPWLSLGCDHFLHSSVATPQCGSLSFLPTALPRS